MEFREKKAIYIQIAEHVCDQIMLQELESWRKTN
jgi:DNA-binding transcriptional regulator YhcF (GntR family)